MKVQLIQCWKYVTILSLITNIIHAMSRQTQYSFTFTHGVLTAERHYWDGVELILRSDVRPHADNKNISKAGDGRYNPDKHSLYYASQKILKGWNPISIGLTAAHMRGISTVLEFLKISGCKKEKQMRDGSSLVTRISKLSSNH